MDMTDGGADHFYPNERWCTAPLNVGRWGGPSAASSPTRLSAAPGRTHPVTLMNMRSAQTRRRPPPVEKIVEIPASVESLVPPRGPDLPQKPHLPRKAPLARIRCETGGQWGI